MDTSLFNLNNFYIFLIELAFSLLFLIIFCSVHYGLINTTKLKSKLEKSKNWNFWYFFLFGFLLSFLTFIVSQVSTLALDDIGMPLTILGLIYAMTIFYNKSVQIGAIIPTVLWVLYEYNGFYEFNYSWFIRVIVVLVMGGIAIGTTFIKWKKWPTFSISCLITLLFELAIVLSSGGDNTLYYSVTVVVSIAAMFFYYATINSLNKWLLHVSQMGKSNVYIDKHYLIPSVLNEYFNELVFKNNLNQALIVTLRVNPGYQTKQTILDQIYNEFKNDKPLLFKIDDDTYGTILYGKDYHIVNLNESFLGNNTISRQDDDPLKKLESKLLNLNNASNHVYGYASIYGVHSCNLNALLKSNQHMIKQNIDLKKHNIVQLFNSNMTNQEFDDAISYATLSEKVNLSDIDVELEMIKMNKTHKTYVCPRFYWSKLLTCDIQTIMNQFEISVGNTLLRYLAVRSLELYATNSQLQKYPILIYYPIEQLESNSWSCDNLVKKIKLYGININQVVFSFNCQKITSWPKQIIQNLITLQNQKIQYFLVDVINILPLSTLKPNAVILSTMLSQQQKQKLTSRGITILN